MITELENTEQLIIENSAEIANLVRSKQVKQKRYRECVLTEDTVDSLQQKVNELDCATQELTLIYDSLLKYSERFNLQHLNEPLDQLDKLIIYSGTLRVQEQFDAIKSLVDEEDPRVLLKMHSDLLELEKSIIEAQNQLCDA